MYYSFQGFGEKKQNKILLAAIKDEKEALKKSVCFWTSLSTKKVTEKTCSFFFYKVLKTYKLKAYDKMRKIIIKTAVSKKPRFFLTAKSQWDVQEEQQT